MTARLLTAGSRVAALLDRESNAIERPPKDGGRGGAALRIERRVTAAAWGGLWLALFVLCVLARNV